MDLIILLLNILGTFLLSVEAIKLENFEKLRNLLKNSNSVLNPKIEWTESATEETTSLGCSSSIWIIVVCFFPISFIITYSILKNHVDLYYVFGIAVFGSILIWSFIIYIFEFIIKLLKLIEQNIAYGFIGILGFLLLVISFVLQYYSVK